MNLTNNREIIQKICYLREFKGWSINVLYEEFGNDMDIEKILEDHDVKIKRKDIVVTTASVNGHKREITDFDGEKLMNKRYKQLLKESQKRSVRNIRLANL